MSNYETFRVWLQVGQILVSILLPLVILYISGHFHKEDVHFKYKYKYKIKKDDHDNQQLTDGKKDNR